MQKLKFIILPNHDKWFTLQFIPAKEILQTTHCHYFHEVFLTLCPGITHSYKDKREELPEHTICFIRPDDSHSFKIPPAIEGDKVIMFNLAFESEVIRDMEIRFAPDAPKFWSNDLSAPTSFQLDADEAEKIMTEAKKLLHKRWTRMELESFLLNLFNMLAARESGNGIVMPDWLQYACVKIKEPQNLRKGLKKFQSLCGKCHEHISRQSKACLGISPVEFIAKLRADYAARLLANTSMELHEIASECGLQNLSYFFATFKKHYNTTPRKYRIATKNRFFKAQSTKL